MGDSRTRVLPVWARYRGGDLLLALHVQPGARRTAIVGEHGDRLKLALLAPPVDGKANEALVRFLADVLGRRRQEVRLLAGATSREKTIGIPCATEAEARSLADRLCAVGAAPGSA